MTAAQRPPEPPLGAVCNGWLHPARAGFEALVGRGPVLVAVATCFEGVAPARFQASPHVTLRFGHHLRPPIRDLSWDDRGIVGTMVFGDEPFTCRVPWLAVVAMQPDFGADSAPSNEARNNLKLVP